MTKQIPFNEITDVAKALPAIWDTFNETRKALINRDGFLYACDYEIRLNLDLIDSLNSDPAKVSAKSPAFIHLVNSFETSAMHVLIIGSDRRNYRRLIKLLDKELDNLITFEKEDDKEVDDNEKSGNIGKPPDPVKSVLEALHFASRKIETLRRIARIAQTDDSIFKQINLNTRLKNIGKALREIREPFKIVLEKNEKRIRRCCL